MSCKKVVFGLFTLFLSLISFTYGTNYLVYHNPTDGLISFVSGGQTIFTMQDHVVGQNCTYQDYLNGSCSYDDFLGCYFQVHNNYCFRYNGLVNKTYNIINSKPIGSDYGTFYNQYNDYYYFLTGGFDNIFNNNCTLPEYNYNVPYFISGNDSTFFKLNMYGKGGNLHYYCNGVNASQYGGTLSSLIDYFKEYSPWFNSGSIYGKSPCGTGFSFLDVSFLYDLVGLYSFSNISLILDRLGIFYHGSFNNKQIFNSSLTANSFFWSTNLNNWSSTSNSGYISLLQGNYLSNNNPIHYFSTKNTQSFAVSYLSGSTAYINRAFPILCQSDTPINPNGSNWHLIICDGSDCGSSAGSSSYTVNYNNGQIQSFTTDQSITINGYSLYNGSGSFSPYFNISYTDQDNQVLTESYDKTNLILGGKFEKTYTGGESNFWVLSAISQGSIPDIIYTGLEFTGSSNISGNIFTNFVDNSFDVIGTNIPNFISYGFVLIVLIILIRLIKHFKKGGKGRI